MASCTAWTGLSIFLVATPSAVAALITAIAVVADDARRFSTAGSSAAPGALTSTWPATASEAARSMPSVTLDAPATIVPRPRPGYTRALLDWPKWYVTPPYSNGSMGSPVATSAVPLDQVMMSAGRASIFEVGLETGKITGRSTAALIASTTSLVNAPWAVEAPIRIVGFTFSITVCRPMIPVSARTCCRAAISGHRTAAAGSISTGDFDQPETSAAGRTYGR